MNEDLRTFYRLVRRTRAGVLEWLEQLPDGVFEQEDTNFAFGSLRGVFEHTADVYLSWIGVVGLGRQDHPLHVASIGELREAFDEVDATVDAALDAFTNLDAPFEWSPAADSTIVVTRRWLILHPITHEFHHKGQALAIARMLGHPHPGSPDTDLIEPEHQPARS